uniref:AAA+ ATPase domain-containing protein n=1 Tax=Leptocylindrus danicus TaxID=163516 RepID=A0A7S2NRJ4_9STRA|mmetsp:Transcript_11098/g.16807  ORF Transcript_11098/g.16807 Transcript_11098/m.16807 type:complete len:853 (+) Transcript_11098:71-2629(+)
MNRIPSALRHATRLQAQHRRLDRVRHYSQQNETTVLEWLVHRVKVPKGFENFFPKNNKGGSSVPKNTKNPKNGSKTDKPKAGSAAKPDAKKTEENPFAKFSKQRNSSGGGGNNNSQNNGDKQNQWGASLATMGLLGLFLILNDNEADGREVTWSEFRNFMLEPNIVEKVVIIPNKNIARITLQPGAQYNKQKATAVNGTNINSGGGFHNRNSDHQWGDDATIMEMSPASTSTNNSGMMTRSGSNANAHANSSGVGHFSNTYYITISTPEAFERKLEDTQRHMQRPERHFLPVTYLNETTVSDVVKAVYPLLMIGGVIWMMRGNMGAGQGGGGMGGIFRVGKSTAKSIKAEDVSVKFKDVAGCDEAKKEVMEFVSFLSDPLKFQKLGAKIPKGALLCGPPGTGKTLLAKAVAGEANVPFFTISGSDFIEMFVGVGPARVRDLFSTARQNSPCIVFIDEIDAVGRKRSKSGFGGGNDERENTLNQLLVEMDGFSTNDTASKQGQVVVLAGTNRADILDSALLRPGRFDRQITIDRPDLKGRTQIFNVHLQNITLNEEIETDSIARRLAALTPGFAGADISNIVNEAAIQAARRNANFVDMVDFEKAIDRSIGGLESNKIISKHELQVVAHHEAGHAIAGWFLEHCDPLLKVTIVPRSNGALGFAQYLPKEVYLRTEDQIMDSVCMALAGRAAEEVFFNKVTTGASDDLRKVTQMVYQTIQVFGMNERIGQLAFPKEDNGGMMPQERSYSDATAQAMDEEAKAIVDKAYERTLDLMRKHKEDVEKVATLLLDKETITRDDIEDLVGKRPFEDQDDGGYREFVQNLKRNESATATEENEGEEDATPTTGGANPGLI